MENNHSVTVPANIVEQAIQQLRATKTLLLPYMKSLTPEERRVILKMGEKSLTFVEKAHDFAHENPEFVPAYLDMDAFDIDFADAHGLWKLHNDAEQISQMLDDTVMSAGSESFQASLVFYHAVREAAAQDVPGAKVIYAELRKRYPGGRHKPVPTNGDDASDDSNSL
jgi:hypothetical protein